MQETSTAKPNINVTPLIDVLLVLLIIFMVVSPLKPTTFKANIPSEPKPIDEKVVANINTLIVSVNPDSTLKINDKDFGTVADPSNLIAKLSDTFNVRTNNGIMREGTNQIEKTVFIKAPKNVRYGEVAKVVDAVKQAGAFPIGLQIDNLQ